MVWLNEGIEAVHKSSIRGTGSSLPTSVSFAGSDNTFTGSETDISNEYIRKLVTWSKSGLNSKFTVQLSSLEAVGSNIQAIGLVGSDLIGSGTDYTLNPSFIGTKTNAFNVQLEGEVVIRRPNV